MRLAASLTFGNFNAVRWVRTLQRPATAGMREDCRQHRVDVQERLVGQFFLLINAVQNALDVGGCACRQPESADARLNLFGVKIEIAFVCGRAFLCLDIREVHCLGVLLEGHRSVDLESLIQRVENFIGQWTDTALRAILIGVVGQLARHLLTVHTIAEMPSAVSLVNIPLLHDGTLSDQEQMCNSSFHKCNIINVEEWQSG